MFQAVVDIISYPFLTRALIAGALISVCAALLGVSLVLKRYSMIGDGLSHVGFGAMAVASVAGIAPLAMAIPVCVVTAFLLLRISSNSRMGGDAGIAALSSGALAVGVMVISMSTGVNTDIYNYMFGSILALDNADMVLCAVLSVIVIVVYCIFYNRIFAVTFDDTFARATGIRTNLYNMILAVLTAVTVVLGMRMMGALLISCLIIFPAITSMKICRTYKSVIMTSAIVSVVCFVCGFFISYWYETPAGASVVIVNIVALLATGVLSRL